MKSAPALLLALGLPIVRSARAYRPDAELLSKRAPPLPAPWTSRGCYTDAVATRTLTGATFTDNAMTANLCIAFCAARNFIYSGTEYSTECYCGNGFANGGAAAPIGDCNMNCGGDATEKCGAGGRLNVYWNGQAPPQPPAPPVVVPAVGLWQSLGCYVDVPGRTLTFPAALSAPVTIQSCTTACFTAGYRLAGAEYSAECFCGNQFANGGAPATSGCTMPCAGNASQFCGGPDRLNVYNYTGTPPTPPTNPPVDPPPGGGPTLFPVTTGLAAGWTYKACYVDNAFGRAFINQQPDSATLTVASCVNACRAAGFSVAGTEYSKECYCGNSLINGAVTAPDSGCQMPCGGATTQPCGGPNRLSVYSNGNLVVLPVPAALTTGLPGNWAHQGCMREAPGGPRLFQKMSFFETTNTVLKCTKLCSDFGYPAAGLQSTECWCGDHTDIAANGGVLGAITECNMACTGDPVHTCGGFQRLQLYEWTGGINTWSTPANKGMYRQLIGGVVIPLIATLGINNKVTFLEKGGTSQYANSTGAYELDLSQINNLSKAWRPMHVKTDVFCAASIILPDKAGRQLNVGGWSLGSTFGVRLFTPDGSPGQPSVNDWEENPNTLKLQDGRWYPTALVLANGSVLVVGGEAGSNGAPVPTLEILPTPAGGRTAKYLDWLFRTDPDNLYPFLFVLPSTKVFVAYYNEARVLDPVTFDTLTVLPNAPAHVNDPSGGRTYPLEGAAMILPQRAPYTDPLVILICGGSTGGAGNALDNCVSIAPEAPNPTWTIERMPSKRVMPCMVNLPDGTFMIMNGAKQGYAGFGLANDPNLNAILYDPSKPVNQRFSILGDTIVARMYHSEATLLHDGRVLISGSDPEHINPDGTNKYPQEFRIEEYIPPYLNQGRTQPTYTIAVKDWTYGSSNPITVNLAHGTTAGMRISLISAASSTHGNTMGSRTIFPAFSCAGNVCTITAPPNAGVCPPGWHMLFVLDGPTPSIAQWVRIGGDPARLGAWPPGPDFVRPGV